MPRVKSDSTVTHRIEMGAWERENIGKPVAEASEAAALLSSVGILALGAGAAIAGYSLYWFWQIGEKIVERASDVAESDSPLVPIVSPAFWLGREINRRI